MSILDDIPVSRLDPSMMEWMDTGSKTKEINDLIMETQLPLTAKVPPFIVVCKEIHQSHDCRISNPIE
jgi:hypothetical protein